MRLWLAAVGRSRGGVVFLARLAEPEPIEPEICSNNWSDLLPLLRYAVSRRRNWGNPGPSSRCSNADRPLTASISAETGPRTSAPSPQVRPMSLPRKRIPRNRPSGTNPNGQGAVKNSIANAANSGSGSKGRPSGPGEMAEFHPSQC